MAELSEMTDQELLTHHGQVVAEIHRRLSAAAKPKPSMPSSLAGKSILLWSINDKGEGELLKRGVHQFVGHEGFWVKVSRHYRRLHTKEELGTLLKHDHESGQHTYSLSIRPLHPFVFGGYRNGKDDCLP